VAELHALVSGAGLVGLSAASLLADRGYKVLVVDPHEPNPTPGKLGSHLRSAALSPVSINFLQSLGLDLQHHGQDLRKMIVWESIGTGSITFDVAETKHSRLAAIFEQDLITSQLAEIVKKKATLDYGTQITSYQSREVTLSDDRRLTPELLVIAEGSSSNTCEVLNVKHRSQHLKQHALATVVKSEGIHQGLAIQRFSPTPCAFLPLQDPYLLSVIWTLDEDRVDVMRNLSDSQFLSLAFDETEGQFGRLTEVDHRIIFPLTHRLVEDFNPAPNILVLGDSAHTVHPLAGQGVNLGLEDVESMTSVLESRPHNLGQAGIWRQYSYKRKFRAASMLRLMEFFSAVWHIDSPYFRLVRNFGVRCVNRNHGLKQYLMKEAMGLGPLAKAS